MKVAVQVHRTVETLEQGHSTSLNPVLHASYVAMLPYMIPSTLPMTLGLLANKKHHGKGTLNICRCDYNQFY